MTSSYRVRWLKRRLEQQRVQADAKVDTKVDTVEQRILLQPVVFEGEATGAVTSVPMKHGVLTADPGVPISQACQSKGAVVVWRAGSAPVGTWTLTLRKKPAGERDYLDTATMSVTVNHG